MPQCSTPRVCPGLRFTQLKTTSVPVASRYCIPMNVLFSRFIMSWFALGNSEAAKFFVRLELWILHFTWEKLRVGGSREQPHYVDVDEHDGDEIDANGRRKLISLLRKIWFHESGGTGVGFSFFLVFGLILSARLKWTRINWNPPRSNGW